MIKRFKNDSGLELSAGLNNERSVSFEPNDKGLEVYASGIEDVVKITLDEEHEEALFDYLQERLWARTESKIEIIPDPYADDLRIKIKELEKSPKPFSDKVQNELRSLYQDLAEHLDDEEK